MTAPGDVCKVYSSGEAVRKRSVRAVYVWTSGCAVYGDVAAQRTERGCAVYASMCAQYTRTARAAAVQSRREGEQMQGM